MWWLCAEGQSDYLLSLLLLSSGACSGLAIWTPFCPLALLRAGFACAPLFFTAKDSGPSLAGWGCLQWLLLCTDINIVNVRFSNIITGYSTCLAISLLYLLLCSCCNMPSLLLLQYQACDYAGRLVITLAGSAINKFIVWGRARPTCR